MTPPSPLHPHQDIAYKAIMQFITSKEHDTFVLTGFAGTGKTFLLQYLAACLTERKIAFKLLATTGRAAAVLRGKTKLKVNTVHGELYQFRNVTGLSDDPEQPFTEKNGQMSLFFTMRKPDENNSNMLYIIDEASMLGSEPGPDTSFATFGTGRILDDLLEAIHRNKIIFVGDTCQLPPISQNFSPALHIPYLTQTLHRKVANASITEIVRQKQDNEILALATKLRLAVDKPNIPDWVKLPVLGNKNAIIHATENELLNQYLKAVKTGDRTHVIAISPSNNMCTKINNYIRNNLYGYPNAPLQVGDMLMVTQNNLLAPLSNGDFVVVLAIGTESTEANLKFVRVRVKNIFIDTEYELLLAKDLLTGYYQNLTKEQHSELMKYFVMKIAKKNIRPNTKLFNDNMQADPFLNSLRAVYGYAVTCHKAQGGEWDYVYLFLNSKMYGPILTSSRTNILRWWYTAITRAKEQIHLHYDWWLA